MPGYNRTIMVGNLTRDPELKQLSSGTSVCRLSIASNRKFKNKQTNEMVQDVCYIDVDVWGPQAESCNKYLQKGRPVLIEGRLKFDSWHDAEGKTRTKHSIVADSVQFLGSNQDNQQKNNTEQLVTDQFKTETTGTTPTESTPGSIKHGEQFTFEDLPF